MSTAALTFDEARHEYRHNGNVVPGVTSILARLAAEEYAGVPRDVMERAAALGRAVHLMIELDLRGTLDIDSLSGDLPLYFNAWRNFLNLSGFNAELSEQRVHSLRYGYAGTLDLFGILNHRLALIDAKRTAAVPRTAGPQTAAYELALRETLASKIGSEPIDRFALHLRADGSWRLVPFTDKADQRVFLSCLTIQQWSHAA